MKVFHICFLIAVSLLLNRVNCGFSENNQLVIVETNEENETEKPEKMKFDSKHIFKSNRKYFNFINNLL